MTRRKELKSFLAVLTAIFFFCTFVLGCTTTSEYRQVKREEGKVSEYFTTPSGNRVEVAVVEDAIRRGDTKTLAKISKVFRPTPKEQIRSDEYQAGEVSLYQEYAGGTKFINVGRNPENMKIPPGWWPIGLPKDVNMTVGGGKDGKKLTTGVLKKGEVVWVYTVVDNGKPRIDPKRGILLQLGAVKQCGNKIHSDIKMWYPLPLLRQVAQNQVEILVLQRVIDRGQATVYMEREIKDNSKYWMAGLIALAAIGGFFLGRSQSSDSVRTVNSNSKPPNTPNSGEPCPTVPYIGSDGVTVINPAPAPRPAP